MAAVLFNTSDWVLTSIFLACVWNQLQAFSKKVSSSFINAVKKISYEQAKPSTIQEIDFERPKVKGNHCSNISTSPHHPLPILNKMVLFDAIHKVYPCTSVHCNSWI